MTMDKIGRWAVALFAAYLMFQVAQYIHGRPFDDATYFWTAGMIWLQVHVNARLKL